MDTKQNEATNNRPQGDRVLNAALVRADIAERIAQIRSEGAWQNGDRNAITLVHNDQLRVVLIGLHQNAELNPHTTEGAAFLQVLQGRIWIETLEQSLSLDQHDALFLEAGTPRSFFAEEETILLLTITGKTGDNYTVDFNKQSTF